MGVNDAAEQLQVAIEECGKLERELATVKLTPGHLSLVDALGKAQAERDAALAVVEQFKAERDDALKRIAALMSHLEHWDAEHDRAVKAEALEEVVDSLSSARWRDRDNGDRGDRIIDVRLAEWRGRDPKYRKAGE